ncbi:MAG: helix-turn-helix domain-containing protein [Subdoligranulum sp.]|nr:helix-turn-helix domain-containing protein [Subdoligranulum sp.]
MMKIDAKKLDLALAKRCMNLSDLREGSSQQTLKRIRRGEEVKPATAGRIARALGVDVSEIIKQEGE